MRHIKIKESLLAPDDAVLIEFDPENFSEDFLKHTGILITNPEPNTCPITSDLFLHGQIVNEEKFSEYISKNNLNYEFE